MVAAEVLSHFGSQSGRPWSRRRSTRRADRKQGPQRRQSTPIQQDRWCWSWRSPGSSTRDHKPSAGARGLTEAPGWVVSAGGVSPVRVLAGLAHNVQSTVSGGTGVAGGTGGAHCRPQDRTKSQQHRQSQWQQSWTESSTQRCSRYRLLQSRWSTCPGRKTRGKQRRPWRGGPLQPDKECRTWHRHRHTCRVGRPPGQHLLWHTKSQLGMCGTCRRAEGEYSPTAQANGADVVLVQPCPATHSVHVVAETRAYQPGVQATGLVLVEPQA